MRQKQLKVGLPDTLREWLEAAAKQSGRPLADEIRTRLQLTFRGDAVPDSVDAQSHELIFLITGLMDLVRKQTGYEWHEDPGAFDAFREALLVGIDRLRPKEKPSQPPGLQTPIVASDDPKTIGLALEALLFSARTPAGHSVRLSRMLFERPEMVSYVREFGSTPLHLDEDRIRELAKPIRKKPRGRP